MTFRSTLIAASSAALLVVSLAGCSMIGDTVGQVVDVDGDTSAFDVKVGDCINDAEATAAEEVSNVTVVECTEPHDYEAYEALDLPDGEYPGADAVDTSAGETCTAAFDGFAGIAYDDSQLDFTYFAPTSASWDEGDREILCLIVDLDETGELKQSTVSLEGAGR